MIENFLVPLTAIFMILIIFIIFMLFAGLRVIVPNSKGIKIRNKKYIRTIEPGFHWIIPFFDKVVKVKIEDYQYVFNDLVHKGLMKV